MAQTNRSKKGHAGEAVAISAGLAALAAASYYFLGPKGPKHRKQLKSWSIKMKGEVVEQLEKLQDVSEPVYRGIVDAVAAQYTRDARASATEIAALANELKRTWRSITSSVGASSRKKAASKKPAKRKAASKPAKKKASS